MDADIFLNIGTPHEIIESIKKGIFQVEVSPAARKKRAAKINHRYQYRNERLDEREETINPTDWDDIVNGQFQLSGKLEVWMEMKVVSVFKQIICEFLERFKQRHVVFPYFKTAAVMLDTSFTWYKDNDGVDDGTDQCLHTGQISSPSQDNNNTDEDEDLELVRLSVEKENIVKAKKLIYDVLQSLPEPLVNELDVDTILPGYLLFVKESKKRPGKTLEDLYKSYWDTWSKDNSTWHFRDLFEIINIKSFSEQQCEQVGSVLSIAVSKGRHLEAGNFEKEILLQVNSPPLHILEKSVIPKLAKEFLRKITGMFTVGEEGPRSIRNRLLQAGLSASLKNFRDKECDKSKLPCDFFFE